MENARQTQTSQETGGPAPKNQALAVGALLALVMLASAVAMAEPCVEPDFWNHLSLGRYVWESRSIPDHNPFTYVPSSRPWVNHTLVSSVLIYALSKAFGLAGLQAYRLCLCFFTGLLLYLAARKRGASRVSCLSCLVLVAIFFGSAYPPFLARSFGALFFTVFLFILETARQDKSPRRLLWLVPLCPAWASLHVSLPSGLVLMAIYGLWDISGNYKAQKAPGALLPPWQSLFFLFVWVSGFLASLANPFGMSLWWNFLEDMVTHPEDVGGEWLRLLPSLGTGFDLCFTASFLCLVAAAIFLAVSSLKKDRVALSVLLIFGLMPFFTIRHALFFAFCFAVYAPVALDRLFRRQRRKSLVNTMAMFCVLLCLLAALGSETFFLSRRALLLAPLRNPFAVKINSLPVPGSFQSNYYPTGTMEFMKEARLSGNVLTYAIWGGYVAWQGYPRLRVAVDGRIFEEYPRKTFNSWVRFYYGEPGWQGFLERYPPDYILVHGLSRVDFLIRRMPGWEEIYRDATTALYARKEPETVMTI